MRARKTIIGLALAITAGIAVDGAYGYGAYTLVASGFFTTPPQPVDSGDDGNVKFDPCKQLPDHALAAQGLDPASKGVVTDELQKPTSWRVCDWSTPDRKFSVGIFATRHTMYEARHNEENVDFSDLTINGRKAQMHHSTQPDITDSRTCFVEIPFPEGMIMFDAGFFDTKNRDGDTCELVRYYATMTEPYIPK